MKRFLPISAIVSVLLFSAIPIQKADAQALLVENFDYPDGTILTSVGWTAHSAGLNAIDVSVPGLTFTGYPLSGIGGTSRVDNTGEDISRTFTAQTSGTVYAAFMVKVNGAADGYFMHLGGNPIGTTFRGKVFLIGTADPINFGLSVGSNTATPVTGGSYSIGSTYLFVLKYEIVEGTGNNIVSLFIVSGAVPASEPVTPTIGPLTDAAQTDINPASVALRQFSANQNINIDGIRVATTWTEAVTAVPSSDLTAPVFTAGFPRMANIDATRADLQVNMDEPGKAYYIVIPDGATIPTSAEVKAGVNYGTVTVAAHGTIDVVAPGTTYSAAITGLTDKTNYDIFIIAEDDETVPNSQAAPIIVNLYTIRPPDVLLSADFETAGSLAPFTQVSITGDQIWSQSTNSGNGFAKMSGFATVTNENTDWLISPAINLASAQMNAVSFMTALNFTGPALKVMISSTFDGTYTPAGVTSASVAWIDITSSFAFSSGTYTWAPSGELSLSLAGYTGTVYIAFVYESSSTLAATWEVDDFKVTGYLLPGSDATLSDLKVDGTTVTGFDPATMEYKVRLAAGTTVVPAVTYTTKDPLATAVITAATDLTGAAAVRTTTVAVTAADGTTKATYNILFDPIIAVSNLAALRAVPVANYDRTYKITGEVVITGMNATQRGQKYVQDASAAVLIDDPTGIITTTYAVGDGITGLTGTLLDYFEMLEFVPTDDPGAATSTGKSVAAQTLTVSEFKTNFESYESELVKITGLDFTVANGILTFETKKNYDVTAGTDATVVRTVFLTTDLTGAVIPNMADVTGIAVWDFSAAKIAPRKLADLNIYSADATLSDLKVNGTTVTGFAAGTLTYNVALPAGTTVIPTVTATAADAGAGVAVVAATSLTGDAAARTAKVNVTSHDLSATKQYSVVFTVATGLEETGAGKIRIYPVPTRSDIFAENIGDVTLIEIFDVTGNKQISEAVNGQDQIRIPVGQLVRGIYFIRLTTAKGNVMKRFIKE